MATNLPPVPFNAQVLTEQGFMSPVWRDWFHKVFIRVGGNIASSNDELYSVTTDRIPDDAVTAPKLANDAVDTAAIQDSAVTTLKIADSNVSTNKIADSAVTTAKINDLNVTTGKLANDAVSFVKLLSTDWTSSKVASGYSKLANGLYLQWGVTASIGVGTSSSISFPTAFPTGCLQVVAGIRDNGAASTAATGHWGTGTYSTTGFSLHNRTTLASTFNWFAIGY